MARNRVIFLDLDRDRFFGLSSAVQASFFRLRDQRGRLDQADIPELRSLIERGCLVATEQPDGLAGDPGIDCPVAGLSTEPITTWSLRMSITAAAWEIYVGAYLRFAPTSRLLDRLRGTGRTDIAVSERNARDIERTVAAFERVDYFLGSTNRCLVRSVAMAMMLRSLQISSQLVIGVRTEPFAAHCWIQRGHIALNDCVDHVRNFTPILVVE